MKEAIFPLKPYFGADIRPIALASGKSTHVVCDAFDNRRDYLLSSVDTNGAIVPDEQDRYMTTPIADLGSNGARIHLGPDNNPSVKPGEQIKLTVGVHEVIVFGTSTSGVTINGEQPERITRELEDKRLPRS